MLYINADSSVKILCNLYEGFFYFALVDFRLEATTALYEPALQICWKLGTLSQTMPKSLIFGDWDLVIMKPDNRFVLFWDVHEGRRIWSQGKRA